MYAIKLNYCVTIMHILYSTMLDYNVSIMHILYSRVITLIQPHVLFLIVFFDQAVLHSHVFIHF